MVIKYTYPSTLKGFICNVCGEGMLEDEKEVVDEFKKKHKSCKKKHPNLKL